MTKIRALSGFAGKGPACFLAEIGDARLLLDLGEDRTPAASLT